MIPPPQLIPRNSFIRSFGEPIRPRSFRSTLQLSALQRFLLVIYSNARLPDFNSIDRLSKSWIERREFSVRYIGCWNIDKRNPKPEQVLAPLSETAPLGDLYRRQDPQRPEARHFFRSPRLTNWSTLSSRSNTPAGKPTASGSAGSLRIWVEKVSRMDITDSQPLHVLIQSQVLRDEGTKRAISCVLWCSSSLIVSFLQ